MSIIKFLDEIERVFGLIRYPIIVRTDQGEVVIAACAQCGLRTGAAINQTFTCEPGGEPVEAWLHRECEAAFLQSLDDLKAQTAPPKRRARP